LPPEQPASALRRCLEALHRLEDGVLALLLLAMIVLASTQIFLRNFFDATVAWGDPLLRIMVLWVGLLGALAASRSNQQITVDVLSRLLRGRLHGIAQALACVFTSGVCGLLAYHAGRMVASDREAGVVAVAGLPAWPFQLVLPFAFGLIALRYLIQTLIHLRAVATPEPAE
jgi:TRAP-type C4-dicarboxylate transport system permease small subunit